MMKHIFDQQSVDIITQFGLSREYLIKKGQLSSDYKKGDIHYKIKEIFNNSDNPLENKISQKYNDLRKSRNDADYSIENYEKQLIKQLPEIKKNTKEIISILNDLTNNNT